MGFIKLLGIVGAPLQHSLSPGLHNWMCKKYRLPFVYFPLPLKPNQLRHLPKIMRLTDIWGLNVTAPYKQTIIPYLDRLDRSAKEAQAVNTIVRRGTRLIGYNTDAEGWWQALQDFTSCSVRG